MVASWIWSLLLFYLTLFLVSLSLLSTFIYCVLVATLKQIWKWEKQKVCTCIWAEINIKFKYCVSDPIKRNWTRMHETERIKKRKVDNKKSLELDKIGETNKYTRRNIAFIVCVCVFWKKKKWKNIFWNSIRLHTKIKARLEIISWIKTIKSY